MWSLRLGVGLIAAVAAVAMFADISVGAAKKEQAPGGVVAGTISKMEPDFEVKDAEGKVILSGTKVVIKPAAKIKKGSSRLRDPYFVMNDDTAVEFRTKDTKLATGQYAHFYFETAETNAEKEGLLKRIVVSEDPEIAKKAKKEAKKKASDE